MDKALEQVILDLLTGHNILTLATNRPDGWPQATTVGYANDGLDIYVATFPQSQKVKNIRQDHRVSLTIDHDTQDWNQIKGLSMAAVAEVLTEPQALRHAEECLIRKFPQMAGVPVPDPSEVTILRLRPKVISVLDYEKGFGHTEYVEL